MGRPSRMTVQTGGIRSFNFSRARSDRYSWTAATRLTMDRASAIERASAAFPRNKERPAENNSMSINGSLSWAEKAWSIGRSIEVVCR